MGTLTQWDLCLSCTEAGSHLYLARLYLHHIDTEDNCMVAPSLWDVYEKMCVSGSLSPWQRSPQLLVCRCAPLQVGKETSGSQRVQVGLWEHPGLHGALRTSSLPTEAKCTIILEGSAGTDQSRAWEHRLPSAPAGAAASAAQEKAAALVFQANRGFVSKGKYPYLGETLSYSYLNQIGSLWYLTLLLKWALGCFCRCSMHRWKLET